jgi:hypothetical protein
MTEFDAPDFSKCARLRLDEQNGPGSALKLMASGDAVSFVNEGDAILYRCWLCGAYGVAAFDQDNTIQADSMPDKLPFVGDRCLLDNYR